jgi:hypothetical protein
MTQTHGPKFRLHEQYLKRAVVTVLLQVSAGHHPEFIVLTQVTTQDSTFPRSLLPPSFLTTQYIFEDKVYQSPIYSVSL